MAENTNTQFLKTITFANQNGAESPVFRLPSEASDISVQDDKNYYEGENVESILSELHDYVDNINSNLENALNQLQQSIEDTYASSEYVDDINTSLSNAKNTISNIQTNLSNIQTNLSNIETTLSNKVDKNSISIFSESVVIPNNPDEWSGGSATNYIYTFTQPLQEGTEILENDEPSIRLDYQFIEDNELPLKIIVNNFRKCLSFKIQEVNGELMLVIQASEKVTQSYAMPLILKVVRKVE